MVSSVLRGWLQLVSSAGELFLRAALCTAIHRSRRAKRPRGRSARPFREYVGCFLADPLPGLTAAEHSAEGATLNPHRIRTLHRHRRVVIPATVRIVNTASPFVLRGPHVDEDLVSGLHGISAQIGPHGSTLTFPLFPSVAHTPSGVVGASAAAACVGAAVAAGA